MDHCARRAWEKTQTGDAGEQAWEGEKEREKERRGREGERGNVGSSVHAFTIIVSIIAALET